MARKIAAGFLATLTALMALTNCSSETYSQPEMCGGRLPRWLAPSAGIGELAILQPITLTKKDGVRWNERQIDEQTLDRYLQLSSKMDTPLQFVLRVENGANCEKVRRVRGMMESALQCRKFGGCGEGMGWRRWPGAKPEA